MGNGKMDKLAHTNANPEHNAGRLISKRKYIKNKRKKENDWNENFVCGWGKEFLIDSAFPSIYRPLIIFYYFAISEGQVKSQHMLLIWGLKAAFPKLRNLEASLEVQIGVESWMEKLGNCGTRLTHSTQPDFQQDVFSLQLN